MANRNTLAIHKLDEFKRWLDAQGIDHRPTTADYQVLQVRLPGDPRWHAIYRRLDAKEHLSAPRPLERLVQAFIHHPEDKHRLRAAVVFNVPEGQVTPEQRRYAKSQAYVETYSAPLRIEMNRCCEKARHTGSATCPDCEEISAGYQASMTDTPPWE